MMNILAMYGFAVILAIIIKSLPKKVREALGVFCGIAFLHFPIPLFCFGFKRAEMLEK